MSLDDAKETLGTCLAELDGVVGALGTVLNGTAAADEKLKQIAPLADLLRDGFATMVEAAQVVLQNAAPPPPPDIPPP